MIYTSQHKTCPPLAGQPGVSQPSYSGVHVPTGVRLPVLHVRPLRILTKFLL